jgi:hypothetical protein
MQARLSSRAVSGPYNRVTDVPRQDHPRFLNVLSELRGVIHYSIEFRLEYDAFSAHMDESMRKLSLAAANTIQAGDRF